MDQKIKERLVGMAVLLLIAVIFIPLILDGQQDELEDGNEILLPVPERPTHEMDMADGNLKRLALPIPAESLESADDASNANKSVEVDAQAVQTNISTSRETINRTSDSATDIAKNTAPENKTPVVSQTLASSPALTENKASEISTKEVERVASDPGSAWVVQTGSFGDRNNAEKEVARLKTKGFPAFLSRYLASDETILYRVRVGPEKDRQRAEKLMQRLSKAGIDGKVRAHP